jgi:sulfur relay (sulfurtransferase) DsrC/TusE family protein
MTLATIAGRPVHVNEEGFLTEFDEWDETLAAELAATSASS